MKEIWKDVLDYEGLYQVSNMGNVKSLNFKRTGKEKILKPVKPNKLKKYLRVGLCKKGVLKHHFVHLLVWTAFVGEIPEGYQINHIDENPENNRLDNLNLMTPKENTNWGTRNERASKALTGVYNTKCSKPVIQYNLEGNFINEYPSVMEVQRQTGFAQTHISACCRGRYKQAYGFVWEYKNVS